MPFSSAALTTVGPGCWLVQDRPEERCPRTSASPVFLGLWAGRLSGSFQREPRWPLPSSPRDSLVGAPCPQAASSERSPQGCQGQSLGRSLAWRPAALCPGSVLAWVSASPSVLQPQAQKYGGGSLKRARDREFDFHILCPSEPSVAASPLSWICSIGIS